MLMAFRRRIIKKGEWTYWSFRTYLVLCVWDFTIKKQNETSGNGEIMAIESDDAQEKPTRNLRKYWDESLLQQNKMSKSISVMTYTAKASKWNG